MLKGRIEATRALLSTLPPGPRPNTTTTAPAAAATPPGLLQAATAAGGGAPTAAACQEAARGEAEAGGVVDLDCRTVKGNAPLHLAW